MTLEVLSFGIGGILIGISVIGGGVELRELRVTKVGVAARCGAFLIGVIFVFMGLGLSDMVRQPPHDPVSHDFVPPAPAPAPAPAPGTGDGPKIVTVDGRPPQPQPPTPAQPVFTGLTGRAKLSWMVGPVAYEAVIETWGQAGVVRVAFHDSPSGMQNAVDQDLVLRQNSGITYYEGSNPRTAGTNQLDPTYSPDSFRVVQLQVNHWTITEICDLQRVCAPVTVIPL